MFKWIQQYREANSHTKYFIINWALYGILIIASTIYIYVQLAYVKSSSTPDPQQVIETNIQK